MSNAANKLIQGLDMVKRNLKRSRGEHGEGQAAANGQATGGGGPEAEEDGPSAQRQRQDQRPRGAKRGRDEPTTTAKHGQPINRRIYEIDRNLLPCAASIPQGYTSRRLQRRQQPPCSGRRAAQHDLKTETSASRPWPRARR